MIFLIFLAPYSIRAYDGDLDRSTPLKTPISEDTSAIPLLKTSHPNSFWASFEGENR